MIMYHATNMIIDKIDLNKSRNRVDFGKGFYLTDKLGTAKIWAERKVELEGEGIPTILCYDVSRDVYKLHGKRYPNTPNLKWLEFICHNRRINPPDDTTSEPRHDFNWVSGPIADDKVVDVVSEYMREEISAKEAVNCLRVLSKTYQLSIHTPAALEFVDDDNVQYIQLKSRQWMKKWVKRK